MEIEVNTKMCFTIFHPNGGRQAVGRATIARLKHIRLH